MYLLQKLDIYSTKPFMIVDGNKTISSNISKLFSIITIIFTALIINQLFKSRINFQDFIINDINK
jgi:hypothetical protein